MQIFSVDLDTSLLQIVFNSIIIKIATTNNGTLLIKKKVQVFSLSHRYPLNCNEFGLYNIVEYYVYAEDDVCLEIKSVIQSLPNLKLAYMNGPDFATYVDVNTEKMYTFKVSVKGLSVNNIYFKNRKNVLKFLNGFEVF